MNQGKLIELFLVNGTADSIITAELSNWNGKAIKIPRIEVSGCTREDLVQPGVYFLFCKEDDGTDSVYIGESENVKERLIQHLRDYQSDKEPYYWNTAVIFTGRDLNKALIRYLENRLVEISKECQRYTVLTKNTYQNTVLKESQISAMEGFLDNIKILINALGYKVIEPILQIESKSDEIFYTNANGSNAKGRRTSEGFVVLEGSLVNKTIHDKSMRPGIIKLRDKYTREKKIINGVTKIDLLFPSSSSAGSFVAGYRASGPIIWKNKAGRRLKDIEQEESERGA